MKIITITVLILISLTSFSAEKKEKKTLKQNINETADQIDSGTRKAIKEVKTLLKKDEKKK